jgi:hypothetical protein
MRFGPKGPVLEGNGWQDERAFNEHSLFPTVCDEPDK